MSTETMAGATQENHVEENENMQMKLHNKGMMLTRAWTELFSFITMYQAELTVKENAMEIAEKEIGIRKKQLESIKSSGDAESEERQILRDEIDSKEKQLTKSQSDLLIKERLLQRVESDLSSNAELLEQSKYDLFNRQDELVRCKTDLERLKSQLTIKEDQIRIKDTLLMKLEHQLMKENSDLKEQLYLEKKAHQNTKMNLRDSQQVFGQSSSSPSAMNLPEFQTAMDLSVEQEDFQPSSVTVTSNQISGIDHAQPTGDTISMSRKPHSRSSFPIYKHQKRMGPSAKWSNCNSRPTALSTRTRSFSTGLSGPNDTPDDSIPARESDVFFPLQLSPEEDSKEGILASTFQSDSEITKPVPISQPFQSEHLMSTSASGGLDASALVTPHQMDSSSQSDNEKMQLTGLGERDKFGIKQGEYDLMCPICAVLKESKAELDIHMMDHTEEKRFCCHICGRRFKFRGALRRHINGLHNQIRRHRCEICDRGFNAAHNLKFHLLTKQHRLKALCQYRENRPDTNVTTD
ncbi:protein krueppel-like isoform X2 [Lineus longissimus]|uniref:protein krueppel-like isoform X2 n=1 Tax=Lineus longissimus TaxID=88925 RepID=UPI00315C88EC